MKIYQSPLFIISAIILLYGGYLYIDHKIHPANWSGLMALVAFVYGGGGVVLHLILRTFLRKNVKTQLIIEIIILLTALLIVLIKNR